MVGHERELLLGVELNQGPHRALSHHLAERSAREEFGQEMVAQPKVGEPALVLHRGVGEPLEDRPTEHAGSSARRLIALGPAVDLGVLDAARR